MRSMLFRIGWMLTGVATLYVAAALADVVSSGTLDPPGAPGPTMKTLDDIPGSWHRRLSSTLRDSCSSERFQCVMSDQAVLDLETGLVWQRTVSSTEDGWDNQNEACYEATTGSRRGWRVPTVAELMSLLTTSVPPPGEPALPAGHPFIGVAADWYWTANHDAAADNQWIIHLGTADTHHNLTLQWRRWCVRGGIGHAAES